jgi:hypothetical protein
MKFLISEQEKQRILEMHQSATSRQYLMEDEGITQSNTPTITIYLPYTLNPKDQSKIYKTNQRAKFTISATKAPDGTFSTTEYKMPIKIISIDGVGPDTNSPFSSGAVNTTDGSIKGSFALTEDMYKKWKDYLGKGFNRGTNKVTINFGGQGKYADFQVTDYNATPTQK